MSQVNLKKFGEGLRNLREKRNLSLREICKMVNYDSSNWSKIERGLISPPAQIETLTNWAIALGLSSKKEISDFIDQANIAQGIIPADIMDGTNVELLPAFFRTIRNQKPSKEEIDKLIRLLRES